MSSLENKKIRVAFVKFGGLSAGGTEKFLQTIAANLDKNKFSVDYFYCDSAPYVGSSYVHATTDSNRLKYVQSKGVNLIKFNVEAKDIGTRTHKWVNTDFFEKFNESNYDIIQTGRAGHPEYPFTEIKKTPIVDSLHLLAGVDNQFNISRVMHITRWSADKWIKMGGDKNRVVIVSHPMEITETSQNNFRVEYNLENKFIFGFHQRNDDAIFSPIPLEAYKEVENKNNHFMILGGGPAYVKQAQELGIKNIIFIPHSGNPEIIQSFLRTLNVYAHGRKDGEVNSTAMAEAMYFKLPIISHYSSINNGHVECIANAGKVVHTIAEYVNELKKLQNDTEYYKNTSENSKKRFIEKYDLKNQMANIEGIYQDVHTNPFPNKMSRKLASFRLKYILFYSWVRLYRKLMK